MSKLKVLTVLKSSKHNIFGFDYVLRMYNALHSNTWYDFDYYCLTDMKAKNLPIYINLIPLEYGWPGWWSKMELFRPNLFIPGESCLYFDLDEIILDTIDELIELSLSDKFQFMMLRGFNPTALSRGDVPASGIMCWKSGCVQSSKIFEAFIKNPTKAMNRHYTTPGQNGDQGFIGDVLGWKEIPKLQDYLPKGFTCGKRSMNKHSDVYPKVKIASWSGLPRPRDSEIPWMKRWWNNV